MQCTPPNPNSTGPKIIKITRNFGLRGEKCIGFGQLDQEICSHHASLLYVYKWMKDWLLKIWTWRVRMRCRSFKICLKTGKCDRRRNCCRFVFKSAFKHVRGIGEMFSEKISRFFLGKIRIFCRKCVDCKCWLTAERQLSALNMSKKTKQVKVIVVSRGVILLSLIWNTTKTMKQNPIIIIIISNNHK